ncbi:metallophosphoesterase [Chloropicon primus]|uniref:acid phosphatase n=1 Tax=Chloropicon primus TaxID=1764295 RepID=A0A5B8MKG3_9CHLO|nr:metallophosphoesterase [Chloropicon primus]UPR00153.1 metallophosphoesterase [Chloropicon primus]|eukprot:QDZ20943.1 metallophosphoesterase [Chloropicon primus]
MEVEAARKERGKWWLWGRGASARKYADLEEGPSATNSKRGASARKYADLEEGPNATNPQKGSDQEPTKRRCYACGALALLVVVVGVACGFGFGFARLSSGKGDETAATIDGRLNFESVFGSNWIRRDSGDEVTFLVVGDWGRDGLDGQRAVARGMASLADELRPDFVISTGDNFYIGGLASPSDSQFETSFVDVYNAGSLQVPWLTVLGNHDYGDSGGCGTADLNDDACLPASKRSSRSPLHQLEPSLRERDWRWFCDRYYTYAPSKDVELFFLDTNPFIKEYYNYSWAHDIPGGLSAQNAEGQKKFLERALESSEAAYKIVVGHHPFFSNGYRGGETDLQDALGPLLERNNVSMYLNGHDHDMQHVVGKSATTQFFTSGAGSRTGRGFTVGENSMFESDEPGFLSARVHPENGARLSFHDAQGDVIYTWSSAG